MLRYSWWAVVVIVIDQITKYWAVRELATQPPIELLPFLNLTLVFNTGAAFGLLSDSGGWQNLFFVVVAVVISIVIVVNLYRMQWRQVQTAIALSVILGGALGNVIDRVWHGYVVDFVDLHYQVWHWPAFNVADAAITVGAILLIIDSMGIRLFGPPIIDDPDW